MTWALYTLGALGLALLVLLIYSGWYFRWESRQTMGMAYYGRPLAERRALKKRIALYSRPVRLLVKLVVRLNRAGRGMPSFEYEGIAGPVKVSSPLVFERAKAYQPRPEDVFVVTQMRCGTTWMQQIVYEVVCRGRGDLTFGGRGHLYAMSPWIDGVNSVSLADAPLVGDRPTRIIKTHLPVTLCPYGRDAKYIYVARHPVSCFASIVDYNRSLLGPLTPSSHALVEWFCSDRMYWQPWPRHVEGWWQWSQSRDNVLFVHFEEMQRDLDGTVERVAAFLRQSLRHDERQRVVARCRFEYMKRQEEYFDMAPPTMFSVAGQFLVSGHAKRHEDVTWQIRDRIVKYCRLQLQESPYPLHRFYPDVAAATECPSSI